MEQSAKSIFSSYFFFCRIEVSKLECHLINLSLAIMLRLDIIAMASDGSHTMLIPCLMVADCLTTVSELDAKITILRETQVQYRSLMKTAKELSTHLTNMLSSQVNSLLFEEKGDCSKSRCGHKYPILVSNAIALNYVLCGDT